VILEGTVGNSPLAMDIDSLGQKVARFALVEAGLASAVQLRIFEPIERDQCAFDATDFPGSRRAGGARQRLTNLASSSPLSCHRRHGNRKQNQ
jgi:hypothetical protein